MAEGGIIGGIEKGIGEPAEKAIGYLYELTRAAEMIARSVIANNQNIADDLKRAMDEIDVIRSEARGGS